VSSLLDDQQDKHADVVEMIVNDPAMNERDLFLLDGTPVLVRRLVAQDDGFYRAFLNEVSEEDLRLRFFGSMHQVSEDLIDKLLHYDPTRAMAFVAVDKQSGGILGVVRLHDDAAGVNAEFAILVRSRIKDRGVGWLLMQHMIRFATWKGLKAVQGQVLASNTAMLVMCAELGFHLAQDPSDPGVRTVTLPVRIEAFTNRGARLPPERHSDFG
jgi:RimJ/RimL family protein N-acetyltransferase